MFTTLLYFLPCLVTLLWFFIFAFKKKTSRQRFFAGMLAIEIFYFATYAVYIFPTADYDLMVKMDSVCIPAILILLAMMIMYLNLHREGGKYHPLQLLLFSPAVIFAAIVGLLYFILGFDYTARYAVAYDSGNITPEFDNQLTHVYGFFVSKAISYIGVLFSIVLMWQCVVILREGGYRFGNVTRFFFFQYKSKPSSVIAVLYIALLLLMAPINVMGRTFLMKNMVLGAVLTVLVAIVKHFICHVEFYSHNQKVTLHSLTNVMDEEDMVLQEEEVEVEIMTQNEAVMAKESVAADAHTAANTIKNDLLLEKFERLMLVDKLYQNDDITMTSVADQLQVSRTTLSNMINHHYGMPFRELLNHYRIDAAKQYLLDNPTATQEAVALECGFKDASALNRKFKDAEGDTPLMWLAKHNIQ